MRTADLVIDGKSHPLCFSARVVRACCDRYGSLSGLNPALTEGTEVQKLDECVWLLSVMMGAGARLAAQNGEHCLPPLTEDELYDSCSLKDFFSLRSKITEAMDKSNRTSVEAVPQKNVLATPPEI